MKTLQERNKMSYEDHCKENLEQAKETTLQLIAIQRMKSTYVMNVLKNMV